VAGTTKGAGILIHLIFVILFISIKYAEEKVRENERKKLQSNQGFGSSQLSIFYSILQKAGI